MLPHCVQPRAGGEPVASSLVEPRMHTNWPMAVGGWVLALRRKAVGGQVAQELGWRGSWAVGQGGKASGQARPGSEWV